MAKVNIHISCAIQAATDHTFNWLQQLLPHCYRPAAALGLLQESDWPVVRVAQAVGYESASRFAERFCLRFGMSPQELRLTRQQLPGLDGKGVNVKGERVSELGELHP